MVPRSDGKELRHNPRHDELLTGHNLQGLATGAARPRRELPGTELLGERLEKWGVRPDDPSADAVRGRLARIRLSVGDQFWFLETAERIAEAEKAKAAWNPKAKAAQYLDLCKIVTAAARLSKEISEVLPPPWTDERARMGLLVAELAAFIEGTLAATIVVNKNASVSLASATVHFLGGRPGLGFGLDVERAVAAAVSSRSIPLRGTSGSHSLFNPAHPEAELNSLSHFWGSLHFFRNPQEPKGPAVLPHQAEVQLARHGG